MASTAHSVKWNSCRNEIIASRNSSQTLKSIKCRMKLIIDWQIHYIHKTYNRLRSLSSFAWFSVSFLSSGRVLVFSPLRLTLHTLCLLVGRRWNMEQEEEEREKQQSEVGRGENNDRRGEGVARLGGLCVSLKCNRWLEILHRSIKRELEVTS